MPRQPQTQSLTLSQHISYICSRLLAYGLPMLYFLVAISFYLKTYDSAQIKITFTQIGSTVLLFIWVTKILIEGRWPFSKKDFVYVAPFFAWLIWGFISFLNSPFQGWAFEEASRRFFYIILALITLAEFRSQERIERLWKWLLAAAWLAIGYGLVQYLDTRFFPGTKGLDPFIWRQAFTSRVFSTFGNPNFYGNFLVIVTPLILASILRAKGSLWRPLALIFLVIFLFKLVDLFVLESAISPSYKVVFGALVLALFTGLLLLLFYGTGGGGKTTLFLLLFGLLILNLMSTETKGAWVGFIAATGITLWLIFEFFLHAEENVPEKKNYLIGTGVIFALYGAVLFVLTSLFLLPFLKGQVDQVGYNILAFCSVIAFVMVGLMIFYMLRRPWNAKKLVYGFVAFFLLAVGSLVLQYSKTRLQSVSFRLFTWIATWEMIQTRPIMGTGIGSFKAAYPAFRRPQIITLEGKSNTETDHSEDEYIEVWQDEGIIGFGIFLWMVLTALFCGFTQLSWYSKLRAPPGMRKKKKMLELEGDPRSYEVLGILGAYFGALIHWTVDVSVRFVSSGVFSGLLPGLLVAYARNHKNPVREEPELSYEKWIRVGLAGIWTLIFLGLQLELIPQTFIRDGDTTSTQVVVFCILAGIILYGIMMFIEMGLKHQKAEKFEEHYPPASPRLRYIRYAVLVVFTVAIAKKVNAFANYFYADVHHNLAIFFSKQGIWQKADFFRGKVASLPPDIKEKYHEYGGALEHYEQVVERNPGFPMARYFTGNVHNDRGSQLLNAAMQARNNGDSAGAERLFQSAMETWDEAVRAYEGTKSLAPNYVQVHHQMGLLDLKRAQAHLQWGQPEKAKEYFDAALEEFYKYRMLDPVFPENYHRIAEILVSRGEFDRAVELYKEGIYYNDVVARQIYPVAFDLRLSEISVAIGRIRYTQATRGSSNPFNPPSPEIQESLEYFQKAVDWNPQNPEAWKGLIRIQATIGRRDDARQNLARARQAVPQDQELKSFQIP